MIEGIRYEEVLTAPTIRMLREGDIYRVEQIMEDNLIPKYQENRRGEDNAFDEVCGYVLRMEEFLAGEDKNRTYLVEESGGQVRGVLGCILDSQRMCERLWRSASYAELVGGLQFVPELINFYVDPDSQHQGIGRRLWIRMIAELEEKLHPEVLTLANRDVWPEARGFYLEQGFTSFGKGKYNGFPTTYFIKLLGKIF